MCGMVAYSSEQEPMAGSHGHGNEPSGSSSVKGGKFLDQLSDYRLLKKDFAPWSWLVPTLFLVHQTLFKVKDLSHKW